VICEWASPPPAIALVTKSQGVLTPFLSAYGQKFPMSGRVQAHECWSSGSLLQWGSRGLCERGVAVLDVRLYSYMAHSRIS
jgi:hypothetical protein